MFCRHCGVAIPTDSKFCPNCGKPAAEPQEPPVPTPPAQPSPPVQTPAPPQPVPAPAYAFAQPPAKRGKTLWIILAALAGALILAGICFGISRLINRPEDSPVSSSLSDGEEISITHTLSFPDPEVFFQALSSEPEWDWDEDGLGIFSCFLSPEGFAAYEEYLALVQERSGLAVTESEEGFALLEGGTGTQRWLDYPGANDMDTVNIGDRDCHLYIGVADSGVQGLEEGSYLLFLVCYEDLVPTDFGDRAAVSPPQPAEEEHHEEEHHDSGTSAGKSSTSSKSSSSSSSGSSSKSSNTSAPSSSATLPDPYQHFGQKAESPLVSDGGLVVTFVLDLNDANQKTVESYRKLLEDGPYQLTESGNVQQDGLSIYCYTYGGTKSMNLMSMDGVGTFHVLFMTSANEERGTLILYMQYSDGFSLVSPSSSGSPSSGGSSSKSSSSSGSKVSSSSTTLPDPSAFFQCGVNESGDYNRGDSGSKFVSFSMDMEKGEAAVTEYLALLEQYNLKETFSDFQDYKESSQLTSHYHGYLYTGSGKVGNIQLRMKGDSFQLGILVNRYYDRDAINIALYYPDEFRFTDPGVRASVLPDDRSGNSSGSSSGGSGVADASTPGVKEVTCTKCHGEKTVTCTACDGKQGKYVFSSTPNYSGSTSGSKSGQTWEKCRKCNGTGSMTCPRCNGTGKH